ncbi:helix-turn-helix domain-containing protein [Salmonella enterica]|uniref:XRE family transcriptional regulator n=1 Tax=Salmonella enterica TaxID=28901 RepID=A0A403T549_SALER|nr:helix-turn-helix transcriptional regulator [Salmonella enterica]EKR1624142.1 helix-turn-helix domain-containing protein [Salmonella enterica subsp. diarizonae serovar 50:k:z:[z50],[z57],[z68], [z86]]EAN5457714.1 XRE family transcriptional regulator [Salmonella enterica]EAZ3042327.1 helix-turn-helix domain-containing protein [Salmonella enterica]ECC9620317.1 XRE family transcriptional regulator [Salmonella enterica subsp. diarizonae]ECG0797018.1 XRE family transcriptional regulator [Salmonel
MKLGEYLRNSGLSQRDFGNKVGASQGMVSHVLNGRARLTGRNTLLWSKSTVGCDISFTAEGEKVINIGLYFNDGKPLHFSLSYLGVEGSQPSFI